MHRFNSDEIEFTDNPIFTLASMHQCYNHLRLPQTARRAGSASLISQHDIIFVSSTEVLGLLGANVSRIRIPRI